MPAIIHSVILFIIFPLTSVARVFENKVFDENIRTVRLFPSTNEIGMPFMTLRSNEVLLFSFDDLTNDSKTYYYTIQQCDYKWEPTNQGVYEYIDGFSQAIISDFTFSANTFQPYVHYRLSLPNEDMKIIQSGNYVIIVYLNTPDEPVLTRRFMVVEPRVNIQAQIVVPRTRSDINRYHEIIFNVNNTGFPINNAQQEIKASILQNQRWDNAIIGLPPRISRMNEMNFDYNGVVIFEAGREYRRFDIRSLRFNGDGVRSIQGKDVYLLLDQFRTNQRYFIENDMNGQYYTDVLEYRSRSTESDYVHVHFNIPAQFPLSNGKIYVGGVFNEYEANEKTEMIWNAEEKMYEQHFYLKQGFYNYIYYFMQNKSDVKDLSLTEGNYFDAENDYYILIYFRPFGERYDRLIGLRTVNSMVNRQR
jgi:hypothetical protein